MEVDEYEANEVVDMHECRDNEEIIDRPEDDHISAEVAQSPVR